MKEEIIEGFVRDQYGYCHYFVENEKAFIYNLYTYPEYRKKGHARNHIEYVIKEIRKTGYSGSIGIEAEPRENSISLESLSSFYTDMGLEVVEAEKPAEMECPSCGCVVDKMGIGHHSAADCVFMHFADLHFAEFYHAKQCAEDAQAILNLTKDLAYIAGIVERGEKRKLDDKEHITDAILNYVKELEKKCAECDVRNCTNCNRSDEACSSCFRDDGKMRDNWQPLPEAHHA